MVIALDTNVIIGVRRLDAVQMAAITAVAAERQLELWLPEVALEEAVAHRRREAANAVKDAENALKRLRGMGANLNLPLPDPAAISDRWRHELTSRFRIRTLTPEAARESLLREIQRTPPTRDGRGARDAAVWLTVMHIHAEKDDPTYFVSENVKDFGSPEQPAELHPALQAETSDSGRPVIFAQSLDALLELLARRADVDVDVEMLDASERTKEAVIAFAERTNVLLAVVESDEKAAALGTVYFAAPVRANPTAVRAVHGYKVGEARLAVAWTDWHFRFDAGALRRFPSGGLAEDLIPAVVDGSFQLWVRFDDEGSQIAEAQVTAVSEVRLILRVNPMLSEIE